MLSIGLGMFTLLLVGMVNGQPDDTIVLIKHDLPPVEIFGEKLPRAVELAEDADESDIEDDTIVGTLKDLGNFNTLLLALEATGLDTVLRRLTTKSTIFAPNDDAFFDVFGEDAVGALSSDLNVLADIILYHIIPGTRLSHAFVPKPYMTMMGDYVSIDVNKAHDHVFVNGAFVLHSDIFTLTGLIHEIDEVLVPPAKTKDQQQQHDAQYSAESLTLPTVNGTMIDVLAQSGIFNFLLEAVNLTGLDSILEGPDPITLFAPNDNAFNATFGDISVIDLVGNDTEAIEDRLLYHMLNGAFESGDLVKAPYETLNGEDLSIDIVEPYKYIFLNGIQVTNPNVGIASSNGGIIHEIDDGVLKPWD